MTDALIETVLARDVLQMQPIAKPALLRHLFGLSTAYPAQILSYNKMLGQLQDAGNTITLAHYLKLLETAFLVSGLELFARGLERSVGPAETGAVESGSHQRSRVPAVRKMRWDPDGGADSSRTPSARTS